MYAVRSVPADELGFIAPEELGNVVVCAGADGPSLRRIDGTLRKDEVNQLLNHTRRTRCQRYVRRSPSAHLFPLT